MEADLKEEETSKMDKQVSTGIIIAVVVALLLAAFLIFWSPAGNNMAPNHPNAQGNQVAPNVANSVTNNTTQLIANSISNNSNTTINLGSLI